MSVVHHGPGEYEVHRDGVEWDAAPIPRRLHRCSVWSHYRLEGMSFKRCACGAQYIPAGLASGWTDKNSRRRKASPVVDRWDRPDTHELRYKGTAAA